MAFREIFSSGTQRVVPCEKNSAILPARVANHSAGLRWCCQFADL